MLLEANFGADLFVSFFRIMVFVLELIYVIFSFVVTRQVSLMNRSFKTDAAGLFRFVALVQLLSALLLVIVSMPFVF